jgi:hypothetical protein
VNGLRPDGGCYVAANWLVRFDSLNRKWQVIKQRPWAIVAEYGEGDRETAIARAGECAARDRDGKCPAGI